MAISFWRLRAFLHIALVYVEPVLWCCVIFTRSLCCDVVCNIHSPKIKSLYVHSKWIFPNFPKSMVVMAPLKSVVNSTGAPRAPPFNWRWASLKAQPVAMSNTRSMAVAPPRKFFMEGSKPSTCGRNAICPLNKSQGWFGIPIGTIMHLLPEAPSRLWGNSRTMMGVLIYSARNQWEEDM